MSSRPLSRRTLLAVVGLGGVEALLAACSGAASPQAVVTSTSTSTVVAAPQTGTSGSAALPSGASSAGPTTAGGIAASTAQSDAASSEAQSSAAQSTAVQSSPAQSSTGASSSTAPSNTSPAVPTGTPVHVRLYQSDGRTYGVGLPIIVYLSQKITDGKPFASATKVTVDGVAVAGAWYFQKSGIYPGYPLEAHYRLENYWPAHAAINLDLPVKGLSAGTGLVFDDSLTLKMSTGAKNITTVDGATERLRLTTDGVAKFDFPVSLGKASTPTFTGTKVVMERDKIERMVGTTPGDEYDLQVPWSVRLTNSGEFIHAASWNGGNIGQRSTSNGCTNLNVDDAQRYFNFATIGDVAVYVNTGGGAMPVWDGYGDWNLSWAQWKRGGSVATS
ncbi:L,D-transpeptidase [Nakamurella sp. PAMC28650]|uniref:L,D-transpeptidase n=1 Tax=Nakamurella sp. PAMC28650 TaxID=2762325 RepID=UPI00164E12BC|nr:L,D-transpeptidase [Nakamurella sp. PAMC28650]QNK80513.1 L,D-transpeptidase [Nakamurella sp. PAMC28650]